MNWQDEKKCAVGLLGSKVVEISFFFLFKYDLNGGMIKLVELSF